MTIKKERVYKSPIGAIPKIVNNFESKTLNQKIFYDILSEENTQLILCHGIAGTGKTYVSIYKALQDVLRRGTGYDKLIIINPTVDVGKRISWDTYLASWIRRYNNIMNRPLQY